VPSGPGLGVRLDEDALGRYAELYRELGGYPYDRDPARPGWFAILPGQDYATPRGQDYATPRGGQRR
jgi:glucarate dehydratase